MAEGVAAVSLASSIVTFVDFGWKVASRIREVSSSTQEAPRVFADIGNQLPLLIKTLESIKEDDQKGSISNEDEQALLRAVEGCLMQVTALDRIIEKTVPAAGDSRIQRARKALSSLRKEKKVFETHRSLEMYKSLINLHISHTSTASHRSIEQTQNTYYDLPSSQVTYFVGRQDILRAIERKHEEAEGGPCSARSVVLLGMGGQGKTQVALEYCRQAIEKKKRFWAIIWIDASSRNAASRSYEDFALKMATSNQTLTDTESKIAYAKETLGNSQRPWLLIFDNYDRPSDFPDVKTFFPTGGNGAMIFTSRHAESERVGTVIRLDGMTDDEGLELLLHRSRHERTEENVTVGKSIVLSLGNLALAIDQAGSYVGARQLPLSLFSKHFQERRADVLKYTPDSLWEYRKHGHSEAQTALSAFTTWELSFDSIEQEDGKREKMSQFLTLCAFLSPARISEDLFRSNLKKCDDIPLWMQPFVSEGHWNSYLYQDTIAGLFALSLLQSFCVDATQTSFSLHPLVRDWLQLRADMARRQACTIEAMAVVATFLRDHGETEKLPLHAKHVLLSHIDTCLKNEENYVKEVDVAHTEVLTECAHSFGYYSFTRDRYKEAESLYRRALRESESRLGPDHRDTLLVVADIVLLLQWQRRLPEAESMCQRALVGFNKLGPDDPDTLSALMRLGGLCYRQGKLAEAETMLQQVLTHEKVLGPKHRVILDTLTDLGSLYIKQRKLVEAESILQRLLTARGEIHGPEHPKTLMAIMHLARVCKNQDKLDEAEPMYERAWKGLQSLLGADHTDTLFLLHELGKLYRLQGKLSKAELYLQQALTGQEKTLGPEHPFTVITAEDLGLVYRNLGKLDGAELLLQRVLAGRERILGPENPSTLRTVRNLALVYRDLGKLAEAENLLQRVLAGREKQLGPKDPATLRAFKNLVNIYQEQGKLEEAASLKERFEAIGREGEHGPAESQDASAQSLGPNPVDLAPAG